MNCPFNLVDIQMGHLAQWLIDYKDEPLWSRIINTAKPPIPVEFAAERLPKGYQYHTSYAYDALLKELVTLHNKRCYINACGAERDRMLRELLAAWVPSWLPVFDRMADEKVEVTL